MNTKKLGLLSDRGLDMDEKHLFSEYSTRTWEITIEPWLRGLGHTVAVDTETTGLNYYRLEMLGISFCDGKRACYLHLPHASGLRARVIDFLREMFESHFKALVMHNANFDLKVLHKVGIRKVPRKLFDTKVAAHLLDEESPTGLKHLAQVHLGAKTTSYKEASASGTGSYKFHEYALNDAIYTWKLHKLFNPQLYAQKLDRLFFDIEMPFQFVLMHLHINGVQFDLDELRRIETWVLEKRDQVLMELHEQAGKHYHKQKLIGGGEELVTSVNFNSPQQLIPLIESAIGKKLTDQTEGGQKSTSSTVLQKYKDSPFVHNLLIYRVLQKAISAFIEPVYEYIDSDGRIRASFNNCGCVTGRLSCSSPNLQQLPNPDPLCPIEYRKCIVAPKGKKLVAADYSGQEMRVLAHISNDPTLLRVFREDLDPHLMTAKMLFNLPIPDECLKTSHPDYPKYKETYKEERHIGKNGINFPIIYGTTASGISKNLNISEAKAQEMIDSFMRAYPGVAKAIKRCAAEVKNRKWVATELGRRRRLDPRLSKSYRQAFNFKIQSLCSDILRAAMVHVQRYADCHPEMDMKIVMTVHDEILFEVKEEYAERAGKEVSEIMRDVAALRVPLEVSYSCGYTYLECK